MLSEACRCSEHELDSRSEEEDVDLVTAGTLFLKVMEAVVDIFLVFGEESSAAS